MERLPVFDIELPLRIALPNTKSIEAGSERLQGCWVQKSTGEAGFVPTRSFRRQNPLWQIDVLQDVMLDFEVVRRHAMIQWADQLFQQTPTIPPSERFRAFRAVCDEIGVHIPANFEALFVLRGWGP
jgi:hypothetical protein